jgi:TM2 domain-containing membrane protein YozV
MTTTTEAPAPSGPASRIVAARDHRGSWIPTGFMVGAKFKELRKRRGLMFALGGVTIGLPAIYLGIRLILHAAAPHSYGPAGGYDQYVGLVAGVLYVFGFIVAATLGATAGSADLTEGMFRHHVITGRSRMALYLARIPAGLAIIWTFVATGFLIVCLVCVFASPTSLSYNGVQVAPQLPRAQFQQWAAGHSQEVINNLPIDIGPNSGAIARNPCLPGPGPSPGPAGGPGGGVFKRGGGASQVLPPCTNAQRRSLAIYIANQDYSDYVREFVYPSTSLMVKTGLWLELEAAVGFLVGLGLSSLLGQRTISVILLIVLEVIVTPIASRAHLPHMVNLQRAIVGLATAHLEPGGLPSPFGGNGPADRAMQVHISTTAAICVIVAWLVGWTILGARRMMTRDA